MNQVQADLCAAFEAMQRDSQMEVLQKEGIYIGKLKASDGTKLLYQYQSIYVEVIYIVHRVHVLEVRCFTDTRILDRYFSSTDFDMHGPD